VLFANGGADHSPATTSTLSELARDRGVRGRRSECRVAIGAAQSDEHAPLGGRQHLADRHALRGERRVGARVWSGSAEGDRGLPAVTTSPLSGAGYTPGGDVSLRFQLAGARGNNTVASKDPFKADAAGGIGASLPAARPRHGQRPARDRHGHGQ
jgi:hypothetical protein